MKNKTLLEAATDMLLNRQESVVAEAVPSINMKKLKSKDIFGLIEKATESLYDKYIDENDDELDIRHAYDEFVNAFEELNSAFKKAGLYEASEAEEDELHEMTKTAKDIKKGDSFKANLKIPGKGVNIARSYSVIATDDAMDSKIHPGQRVSIRVKAGNYTTVVSYDKNHKLDLSDLEENDDEQHDLEEATEVDNIAAKVAELKVGDMTNFGKVMAKSNNSVSFKAKDLPVTKITFNQRKMGSRDYVLSALRLIK
jgi:hypothetical protein